MKNYPYSQIFHGKAQILNFTPQRYKMVKTKWSDYGESSLTIVSYILEIYKEEPAIPRDPADFKRCVHLFECLNYSPQRIKNLLVGLSGVYPIWKVIADNWEKLMKLYEEEKDCETAPKLYDHLQKCRGNYREI